MSQSNASHPQTTGDKRPPEFLSYTFADVQDFSNYTIISTTSSSASPSFQHWKKVCKQSFVLLPLQTVCSGSQYAATHLQCPYLDARPGCSSGHAIEKQYDVQSSVFWGQPAIVFIVVPHFLARHHPGPSPYLWLQILSQHVRHIIHNQSNCVSTAHLSSSKIFDVPASIAARLRFVPAAHCSVERIDLCGSYTRCTISFASFYVSASIAAGILLPGAYCSALHVRGRGWHAVYGCG